MFRLGFFSVSVRKNLANFFAFSGCIFNPDCSMKKIFMFEEKQDLKFVFH